MQGPSIPGSPAFVSPPVNKKQRAGNTPQDHLSARAGDAMSRRRAELQKLSQQGRSNGGTPSASAVMDRARNSLAAPPVGPPVGGNPPILPAGSLAAQQRQVGSTMRGGGRPPLTQANGAPPATAPPKGSQPPVPSGIPPTGSSKVHHRTSDIFPVANKSPISPQPIADVMNSPESAAAATAAAVKSPPKLSDASLARRLEASFKNPSPDMNRSKSAPPSRPPPPPGPPPINKEAPVKVNGGKSVTFSSPPTARPPTKTPSPPIKENVFTPGTVPETPAAANSIHAGATPFHSSNGVIEEESEASPPGAKDLLRQMRSYADTPHKEKSSPELRLQKELASAAKEKAEALRHVTELENEIVKMKVEPTNKRVGFLSPIVGGVAQPNRRRISTPHPKRGMLNPTTPQEAQDDKDRLKEAVANAPCEYTYENLTLVIRRPFGLATERDLWFRVGQVNAKLYASTANVDFASTLEVATVLPDNSALVLHGHNNARLHLDSGDSTDYESIGSETKLGNIAYIDNEGNDKEYSLDELYDALSSARDNYCLSVRLTADAFKNRKVQPVAAPAPQKETTEKGVVTDAAVEPPPKPTQNGEKSAPTKPPPVLPEDNAGVDVMGAFIHFFFSVICGTIWFILVSLPFRVLSSTLVMAMSVLLLSMIWLHFQDNYAAGAAETVYSNRMGIM